MANQTVDIPRVREVEGIVHVAIARMALGAAFFVGGYSHTEVVHEVLLADLRSRRTRQIRRIAEPIPVRGTHDLRTRRSVAAEAFCGYSFATSNICGEGASEFGQR